MKCSYVVVMILWSTSTTGNKLQCKTEIAMRSHTCSDIFQKNIEGIDQDDLYEGSESTERMCRSTNDYIKCLNKPPSTPKCNDTHRGTLDKLVVQQAMRTKKTLKCVNVAVSATVVPVRQAAVMVTSSTFLLNVLLVIQTTSN